MAMGGSAWVAIIGMLTFGTISSLLSKITFEVRGDNLDGDFVPFAKPWFCVAVMFAGMIGCMLIHLIGVASRKAKRRKRSSDDDVGAPLLAGSTDTDPDASSETGWRGMLMLSIPTVFDLIATVLMSIGLLFVTVSIYQVSGRWFRGPPRAASVRWLLGKIPNAPTPSALPPPFPLPFRRYQMMRGAELIFAAIFSVAFLGKRLNKLHASGIALTVVGISMVGMASLLAPGQNGAGTPIQQVRARGKRACLPLLSTGAPRDRFSSMGAL